MTSAAYLARWKMHRLTARWRALPSFIIIGAPRSGTTTLYRLLAAHPQVVPALRQETHFFNRTGAHAKGETYYRSFFPLRRELRSGGITGEGTSVYMFRPNVSRRIRQMLPRVKIIAVLRDPVERAIASWASYRALGEETRGLLEAMSEEIEDLGGTGSLPPPPVEVRPGDHDPAHVHKGRYADQLRLWFEDFPRSQIHVVISEDLFAETQGTSDEVHRFLELERARVDQLTHEPPEASAEANTARRLLADYYRASNRELFKLLGREVWGG